VAAQGVKLLSLAQSGTAQSGLPGSQPDAWQATLGLTKSQALRLIQAQNFARQVRLLPH
jgi:hypothetical protein